MSNLVMPSQYFIDPRVDINTFSVKKWFFPIGAQSILENSISSNQSANNNNVQFDLKMNDGTFTILDPSSLILEMPTTVLKTGTATVSTLFQPDREGFRANALEKVMKNLNMSVKGSTIVSYAPWQFIHGLECFDEIHEKSDVDFCDFMIDNCQQYSDVYNTNASPFATQNTNPFETTRRAIPATLNLLAVGTTSGTATIQTTLRVNLGRYPPLCTQRDKMGFSPDPFQISIDWNSNLSYIWSVDLTNAGQPSATIAVTFGQGILKYRTMILPLGKEVPDNVVYPWHRIEATTVSTSGNIATGNTFILQSTNMELSSYPQKMFIYARQAQSELNTSLGAAGSADFFAQLKSLSVKVGNKSQIFSDCSQSVLYDITRHNGLVDKLDFASWLGISGTSQTLDTGRKGSIFCCDFVKDIGSPDGKPISTSVNTKFNFQITRAEFTNVNASTHAFDLWVILIYDGIISVTNRKIATPFDTVAGDIQSVLSAPYVEYKEIRPLIGGSAKSFFRGLWSKIKEVAPHVLGAVKKSGLISKGLSMIPEVGVPLGIAARSIGFGEGEGDGGVMAYGEGMQLRKKKNFPTRRYY